MDQGEHIPMLRRAIAENVKSLAELKRALAEVENCRSQSRAKDYARNKRSLERLLKAAKALEP